MNPKQFIKAHQMGFVLGTTITTTIGAMALSAYAGAKIAQKTQGVKPPKLKEDPKEFVKTYIVPFIPAVLVGGLSVFSMAYSYKLWGRKVEAANSMAILATTTLANYKDAMKEQLNQKQVSAIEESAAKKDIAKANPKPIVLMDDTLYVKCYDKLSGRYFKATIDQIRKAENKLNSEIINGWYWCSLNDFYEYVDSGELKPNDLGKDLGWSVEHLLSVNLTAILDENEKPCLCLEYNPLPAPYVR